jgi:cytochrome c peroxidase
MAGAAVTRALAIAVTGAGLAFIATALAQAPISQAVPTAASPPAAAPAPPPPAELTAAQVRAIVALGPWPMERKRDPSNRVSGNADAVAFGGALFADPRLSRSGTIACASCHQPDRAFVDGLPRGRGIVEADRNTTTLFNVGGQRWYGWDGASDNLWAQSLRPLFDAREMGGNPEHLAHVVRSDAALRAGYAHVFGYPPAADDEVVAVDVGKALAAFQETLVTGRTSFDDYRDAVARGDAAAAARYPAAARRGLLTFIGEGNCTMCHGGPRFTNGEFGDVGIPYFVAPGRVDAGRHDGIRRLKASRFTLLGPFSDDPARSTAASTRYVALEHRNFGEFRVPSLRSVARTAPYMHNGSIPTLREVVRHYSNIDENRLHADGVRVLKPLGLSKYDTDDLVAFLESLTDYTAPRTP